MENKDSEYFSLLKKDASSYLETRIHIMRLEILEKGSRAIALFSWSTVVLLLVLFSFVFIFLALANGIGVLLDSLWMGYATVVLIYAILIAVLVLVRRRIILIIVNVLIREFTKEEGADEQS